MLVPLDLRLMTLGLEAGSCFEGFRSESIDDDEALVGQEAAGCACDCDGLLVDGFEADIAASFDRGSVGLEG